MLSFSTFDQYVNSIKGTVKIDDSFLQKYKEFLIEHDFMVGKPKTQDQRTKLANAIVGRHFYNNGEVQIQIHGTPPNGFVLGMLPERSNRMKGSENPNAGNVFWSNGIIEVRSKICPGDGFVKGKLRDYAPPIDLFS